MPQGQSSLIERQITNLIRSAVDPDLVDDTGHGLTGTPDLSSRYAKVAVFVDGCYWHGCPKHAKNSDQAAQLRDRDRKVNVALETRDWSVLRVWEHEEHLAPFIASVADTIRTRSADRRSEVLAHLDGHASGEWCQICDGWPHDPVMREDGWCERCMVHSRDHEYGAREMGLFGPPA